MGRKWLGAVATVALLALGGAEGAAPAQAKVSIEVLSNRAEVVSGGDALVAVKFPKGTEPRACA